MTLSVGTRLGGDKSRAASDMDITISRLKTLNGGGGTR